MVRCIQPYGSRHKFMGLSIRGLVIRHYTYTEKAHFTPFDDMRFIKTDMEL